MEILGCTWSVELPGEVERTDNWIERQERLGSCEKSKFVAGGLLADLERELGLCLQIECEHVTDCNVEVESYLRIDLEGLVASLVLDQTSGFVDFLDEYLAGMIVCS